MDIYLDMNIYINYMKQENMDLVKLLNYAIKNTNINFPYSPAHIEEIAVINRKSKNPKRHISQNIKIIAKISKNYEYLPTTLNGIKISYESLYNCYQDVLENYYNTTILAENMEKSKIKNWKSLKLSFSENRLNLINPKRLFNNKEITDTLSKYLDKKLPSVLNSTQVIAKINNLEFNLEPLYKYLKIKKIPSSNILQNNHKVMEILFELIFDFLDYLGYKNDTKVIRKEKYRSRMNDITHSIYATKANYFITDDENFRYKTIAIYTLLNLTTIVVSSYDLDNIITKNTTLLL